MPEFGDFAEWQRAVDDQIAQAWMANGGSLAFDPRNPELGVSHVMQDEEDDGYEVRQARIDTFRRLMDFIWADGPNPLHALRRLMVITRCGSPDHVMRMNQTEVAVLLNETRAATSARELKLWREFMEQRGFFGRYRPLMKSDAARAAYAQAAQGNRNRKGGKRALKKFSALRHERGQVRTKHKPKQDDDSEH